MRSPEPAGDGGKSFAPSLIPARTPSCGARRQWHPDDDPGGAAADPAHSQRPAHVRRRWASWPACRWCCLRARPCRIAADRALRRGCDRDRRASDHRARLGAARGALDVRRYAATIVTGFGVAVDASGAMPPLAQTWLPGRTGSRDRGLCQRAADRRNPAGAVDAAGGAAAGRRRLAARLCVLGCPVRRHRGDYCRRRAAPPCGERRRGSPGDGGRTGTTAVVAAGADAGRRRCMALHDQPFLSDYQARPGMAIWSVSRSWPSMPGNCRSCLLLSLAGRFERQSATYLFYGAVALLGALGIVLGNGPIILAAAGLIGFSTASVLILILALPPLLSRQEVQVPRMAAGMFTISYSCAWIVRSSAASPGI